MIRVSNIERGLSCIIDSKSKKLKRVVQSSTAAEALASNDALDSLVYVKSVLQELMGNQFEHLPIVLSTDSKNLHKVVMGSSLVENPRLRTDIAILKESLQTREQVCACGREKDDCGCFNKERSFWLQIDRIVTFMQSMNYQMCRVLSVT